MMHKSKPIDFVAHPLQSLNHRESKLELSGVLKRDDQLRHCLFLPIILIPLFDFIYQTQGHLKIIVPLIADFLARRPKHELIVSENELPRHIRMPIDFELDDLFLIEYNDLPREYIILIELQLLKRNLTVDPIISLVDISHRLLLNLDWDLLELILLSSQLLGGHLLANGLVLQSGEADDLALLFLRWETEIYFL